MRGELAIAGAASPSTLTLGRPTGIAAERHVRPTTRVPEPVWTAVAAAAVLVPLALYAGLVRGMHHGDALARTHSAVQIVRGYEPKLANIGFAWPPLPTLMQVPLAVVAPRLTAAGGAAPVVSAIAWAVCLGLLGVLVRPLLPERGWRLAAVAVVGLNPLTLALAVSGLSEPIALAFVVGALIRLQGVAAAGRPTIRDAAVLGCLTAAVFLCRYELALLGGVLALAVAAVVLRDQGAHLPTGVRQLRSAESWAMIVALPLAYTGIVFLGLNLAVGGDALYFARGPGSNREFALAFVAQRPALLAAQGDLAETCLFILRQWVGVWPAALLVLPAAVVAVARRRDVVLATMLAAALLLPATQVLLLFDGTSTGWSRYHVTIVVLGPAIALSVASGSRLWARPDGRRCVLIALFTLFAAGDAAAWVRLDDPSITSDFRSASGNRDFITTLLDPRAPTYELAAADERELAEHLCGLVDREPGATILVDDTQATRIILFSDRPASFVTQNVMAFDDIVAAPWGEVDYLLIPDLRTARNAVAERFPDLDSDRVGLTLVHEQTGLFGDAGTPFYRWLLFRVDAVDPTRMAGGAR